MKCYPSNKLGVWEAAVWMWEGAETGNCGVGKGRDEELEL